MHHRVYVGNVISDKMAKTVVVAVPWVQHHRRYGKMIRRVKRLYVHDPYGLCQLGDHVSVEEVRPLSRTKRWLVKQVLQKGDVTQMPRLEASTQAVAGGVAVDAGVVPGDHIVDNAPITVAEEPVGEAAVAEEPVADDPKSEGGRGS